MTLNAYAPPYTISYLLFVVPVFDGTHQFNLARYDSLPSFPGEIPIGSTALVIFTIQRYELAEEKRRQYGLAEQHKTALSFNALAVVVLASKDESNIAPLAPFTTEGTYGVLTSDDIIRRVAPANDIVEEDV